MGWRRWPVFLCVGSAAWFVFLFELCLLGWLGFAGFPLCLYFVAVLFTRWSREFYKKCLWVANLELSEEDLGALTLYPHEEEILQAGRNTS